MNQAAPWPAPAKVNRLLRIVGRRPDGYHLLQTVFQLVDYCDRLWFLPRDDGRIHRVNPLPGVDPEADLTVRAARLLQAETGARRGVDIRIDKRIPMGGGLGGGSSDAATTLVALNQIWGSQVPLEVLGRWALQLGADVPVFVHGRSAWAEGIGEQLTPLVLEEPWFAVVVPGVSVETRAVFADPELTRQSAPITITDFLSGRNGNDCEPIVRQRYPEVGAALDWLGQYAEACLTGTGSSVYATFDDEYAARAVLEDLPTRWRGFVARGLNRSPLIERLVHSER